MRNQVMSFSNEGAEFKLNVPDTEEVRDVFAQQVTTMVQQQKQISTLQTVMQQMASDHVKSQVCVCVCVYVTIISGMSVCMCVSDILPADCHASDG